MGESTGNDRPRVLICDPIHEEAIDLLAREARVDVRTELNEDELLDIVQAYDALVVRSRTQVTREVIEAATGLRVIARAGIGVDNIDMEAAAERGIMVVNAAGASTASVAEMTLALIFAVLRRVPAADRAMKAGHWPKRNLIGHQLRGKTVGVVGQGRIGREVARLLVALGADVLVASNSARRADYGHLVPLDELLRQSDVVTLHTGLTPETERMIDAAAIAKMKDGACLINTARGRLVDEDALLEALDAGKLAGAGLDVFCEEPPSNEALVRHPHVVCTPHIGAHTVEAQRAVGLIAAESLLAALRGERPPTLVHA